MTNHRWWTTGRSTSDAAGPATITLRLKAVGECDRRGISPGKRHLSFATRSSATRSFQLDFHAEALNEYPGGNQA